MLQIGFLYLKVNILTCKTLTPSKFTSAYDDANKGSMRSGNINDKTPEIVGVLINHLTINVTDQNMIAAVIIDIHR